MGKNKHRLRKPTTDEANLFAQNRYYTRLPPQTQHNQITPSNYINSVDLTSENQRLARRRIGSLCKAVYNGIGAAGLTFMALTLWVVSAFFLYLAAEVGFKPYAFVGAVVWFASAEYFAKLDGVVRTW